MAYRLVEVRSGVDNKKLLDAISSKKSVIDFWSTVNTEDKIRYSILVREEDVQEITDAITTTLGYKNSTRVIVSSVEATMPNPDADEIDPNGVLVQKQEDKKDKKDDENKAIKLSRISREELYEAVSKGAVLNKNFLMFVLFSMVVAAIGMIESNSTIVIGSMVIAPLLGPIMAFTFAVAVGDETLASKATITNLVGLFLSFIISVIAGFLWKNYLGNGLFDSFELMSRTRVQFGDLALALMSGAAAALSLTTGTASALVGVMVAVAILPPVATVGIMVGSGNLLLALSAFILLMVNLVCINLSAQIIFMIQQVTPRTPEEKINAKSAIAGNLFITLILIVILSIAIYFVGEVRGFSSYITTINNLIMVN